MVEPALLGFDRDGAKYDVFAANGTGPSADQPATVLRAGPRSAERLGQAPGDGSCT